MAKSGIRGIKWNNPVAIYFVLLYLYIIVNIINMGNTGGGGLLNQAIGGFIVVYCSVFVFLGKRYVPPYSKKLYTTLKIFFVYSIIRTIILAFADFGTLMLSLRNAVTLMFWISSMLFCLQEFENQDKDKILRMTTILIVISIFNFLYTVIIQRIYLQLNDKIGGAVNEASSAFMVIPLVLLALKGKTKIFTYFLCLVICAWSQKRQSLLGFGVVSLFVLIDLIKEYFKNFNFRGVLYIIVVIVFSTSVINLVFSGFLERQKYLSDNNDIADSGRSELMSIAIDGYKNAPIWDQVFGGGAGKGGRYIKPVYGFFINPHCGFIEVLCDYGAIGFVLYVLFFVRLFFFSHRFPRGSLSRKVLLGLCCSWALSNFISHAGGLWYAFFGIAIGFVVNNEKRVDL